MEKIGKNILGKELIELSALPLGYSIKGMECVIGTWN